MTITDIPVVAADCTLCGDYTECGSCDGTGEDGGGYDCGACNGTGLVVPEHCCVCERPVSSHAGACACEA